MVALVRMFGHREVPIEEARGKVRELVERYGKETMLAASNEIVEQDGHGEVQIARLTERARTLAVQLIGRASVTTGAVPTLTATPNESTRSPSQGNTSRGSVVAATSSAVSKPVALPSTHIGERQETGPSDERPDDELEGEADLRDDEPCESETTEPCACFKDRREHERQAALREAPHETRAENVVSTEPPARLSRQEILTLFAESLESREFAIEPFSEFAERELLGSQRPVLDFVAHDEETIQFVTVCPGLTDFQRRDLRDTFHRHVMDEGDLLFRVWPHAGPTGWTWFWYPIDEDSADESDSESAERSPVPSPGEKPLQPADAEAPAPLDTSPTTRSAGLAASPVADANDGLSGKRCDLKHVSHRLDLLAEDLEAVTEKHRQDDELLQSLRDEFEAIRWQVEQATKTVVQPATTEASIPAPSTPNPLPRVDAQRERSARPSQKKSEKRRTREPQQS
jgi:hypothetical protein